MKTGVALSLMAAVAVAGLFWLSPRIHPFVLPARHADRYLALFSAASPGVDRDRDARVRTRFEDVLRAERERVLSAVPALGNPSALLVTVRTGAPGLRPQEIAVDRPRGCRFAGNEPVVCGGAIVGFARPDGDGPSLVPVLGRIRLLANDETRLCAELESSSSPSPTAFGLVGSSNDGALLVRLVTEREGPPDGAAVVTAPGDASVPAGLRIGRIRARRLEGRAPDLVVDPEVNATRQLFLAVLNVRGGATDAPAPGDESFRLVETRVIATGDAAPGRVVFSLSHGSESGIVPGCAVTRGRSLVGRVLRAGPHASQVLATGDPAFRVRALALAADDGAGAMLRAFMLAGTSDAEGAHFRCDAAASPATGLEVVTALGDDELPAGLLVGEVAVASLGSLVLRAGAYPSVGEGVTVWLPTARRTR
ncbi:MAG: hypothetical protein HYR85_26185 [Planctomycetes bacterium]|nr:hypothetical protein [Planctomycetota bacterium]MBI3846945.1 hypothetical protein [Planctomycetota bacterium]